MHCPFLCRNLKKKGAKESHQSPSSSAHHQRNWLGELVFSCLETVPLDPNETPYYKKYTRNLNNTSRPVLPSWLIGPQQRKLKKNGINQVYNYVQSINLMPLDQQGPQTEGEKYMDKKKEIQRAYRIIPPFSKQKKATKIGKDSNVVDSFAYKKKNIQPFSKHTSQDKSEDSKSSSSSNSKDEKIKHVVRELRQINKKQPERLYYKPFSTYKIRQLRDKEAEYKHYRRYSNQRKIQANLQELKLLQLFNSQIFTKSNKNKHKSKAKHIEDNKRKNGMKMKENNNNNKEKKKDNSARIKAPAKIKQSSSKTSQSAETKDKNSDEPTKSTHNIPSVNKKKKRSKPKLFHLDIAVLPIKASKKKPRPREKYVSQPAAQIPKDFPIKQNNKMKERKRNHLNRLAAQAARNYLIKKINGKHKTNIKNLDNTAIKVPKNHQTKETNEKHKKKLDGATGKRPKEKTNGMQRIFGNSLNYTDEELLRKLNHLRRLAKLNLANSAMKEAEQTNEMNGEDATTEMPLGYPIKGTNGKDETRVKYVGDAVTKLPTKTDNKMGKENRTDRTDKVQFDETKQQSAMHELKTTDQTKKIPLKKAIKHIKKKKKIETNKAKVEINEHRYSTTIKPSLHSLKPDDRKSSRSSRSSVISKELIKRQISQDRRMEPRYKEYLKKLNVYDNYTGAMPSNAISTLSIATSGTSKSMALSNDSRSTAKLVHEPKYAISLYGPLPNIEADGSIKVSSVPEKKTLNVAAQGAYEFRNLSQFNPHLSKSKDRRMKRSLRRESIYTTNEPVNSTEVPRVDVHQAKQEQDNEKSRSQLELHIRELLKIVETRDDLPVKKAPRNFVLEAQTKSWPTKLSSDRIKKPVKHKRFELCTKMEKIYVPGSTKPIFVRRYCRKPLPTPPPSELPDVEPAKRPHETCQTFDLSRMEDDPPLIREMKAAWNKIQLRNYYRFIIRRNERESKGLTQCGNKCSHNHCSHIICS
ncbi:uncharacterized protein Dmoj_GI18641 [Drosophila mojavensis]|uniref:Uncharacterized protein n=1 Tax=Drosophila mojavensis TaxID=7230 RepID=B4KPW4_DROMO|nr:uncharacterized protein Dmoj_GI18641 [Drosophila mojavensis]